MNLSFAVILISLLSSTHCKIYSKCELVSQLDIRGVPKHQMGDCKYLKFLKLAKFIHCRNQISGVCLVQHESNFNTQAMNKKNTNGSWDWGIFQINDMYWCDPQRSDYKPKSNACKKSCQCE